MKKPGGIRKKLTLTFTLLVITSLILLGLALSGLSYKTQRSQLLELQHEVVEYAINEISWDIHEIENLLHTTITSYDLLSSKVKTPSVILSQILHSRDIKHHNILDELIFLDSTGRELAKVSRTIVFSASELGERSNTDEFLIPKSSGKPHYGPLTFDETTYEPRIILSLPVLDLRSGAVNGVLLGRIRLNRIWENAVNRSFGKAGIIFITNLGGKIVAHPDPSVIYRNTFFKAKAQKGMQTGPDGKKIMLVSERFQLGSRTFVVHAALPFREILALSLQTLTATAVFVFIFILFSIAVSFITVNHIVRPIESLADNARRISAGKLEPTVKVGNADEIGDLSNAFNTMTSKLLETISSLKQQIDERKLAEEEIIQQNKLLNSILNSLTHPFYVINVNDYTVAMANPAANFGRLSGKSTCYALTHQRGEPCDDSEHPCVIKEIKRTGKPVIFEHIHYDTEGKPMIHEVHGYPIIDRSGNVVQVIEYNLNITKRKKAEEALQLSELKNRSITTTAKDAIIMIDEKGITSFWNPAAEEIFGYTKEEVMNKELHPLIVPDRYLADCRNGIRKFTDTGKGPVIGHTLELEAMKKDGSEFQVELSLSAIKVKDNWNAIGIVRDITQRKESENKILASLKEKDVLLREIHHRVKNNMQIISSLLNLQASVVSDKRDVEMLRDSQNRIKSMSLIHEKLYGSEDLAHIDISDYINDLTRYIFQFHKTVLNNVALKIDIENIWLGIDTAIPCGLIINELVSNSLKHAFPENRQGEVRITLRKTDEGEIELTASDNGIGIPEDLDISKTRSLGLLLVNTLSKDQLQGKTELDRTEGTKFRITFKEVKYQNRT